jgi:hypothetical protein
MEDQAVKAEAPQTIEETPAAPKRGRPKGSTTKKAEVVSVNPPKLHAVEAPSPEVAAAEEQRRLWKKYERENRARQQGVSVESLPPDPEEIEENWEQQLEYKRPPAEAFFAGLYHLTGGAVSMPNGKIAKAGTYARLNAEDGRSITERQIGVWVKP